MHRLDRSTLVAMWVATVVAADLGWSPAIAGESVPPSKRKTEQQRAADAKQAKDLGGLGEGLKTAAEWKGATTGATAGILRNIAQDSVGAGKVPLAGEQLKQVRALEKLGKGTTNALALGSVLARCAAGTYMKQSPDDANTECAQAVTDQGVSMGTDALSTAYVGWRAGAAAVSGTVGVGVLGAGLVGGKLGDAINTNAKKWDVANEWLRGRDVNAALTEEVYFPATYNMWHYGNWEGPLGDSWMEKERQKFDALHRQRRSEFEATARANAQAEHQRQIQQAQEAYEASAAGYDAAPTDAGAVAPFMNMLDSLLSESLRRSSTPPAQAPLGVNTPANGSPAPGQCRHACECPGPNAKATC
jgi:hypothetical protein